MQLNTTEVAAKLGLSKGRISQLVKAGTLAGCWTGDGRQRRFDLARCAEALGARLDLGQQVGNGLKALAARSEMLGDGPDPIRIPVDPGIADDARRLARARADRAELDAQRAKREAQLEQGRYVLAEEVARAQQAAMAQQIAAFERHLIAEAKRVAAELGGDPREAAAEARRRWRAFRGDTAAELTATAEAAAPTHAERAELALA